MQRAERRQLARAMAKEISHSPANGGGARPAQTQTIAVQHTAKETLYPFAEDLEAYNLAIPNGAERLFNNFEAQSQHRQAAENRVIDSNLRQAERGQQYGFFTMLVAVIAAVFLAMYGHDWLAGTIVTVVLAGGFTAFITGRRKQDQDLANKRQAVANFPKSG